MGFLEVAEVAVHVGDGETTTSAVALSEDGETGEE